MKLSSKEEKNRRKSGGEARGKWEGCFYNTVHRQCFFLQQQQRFSIIIFPGLHTYYHIILLKQRNIFKHLNKKTLDKSRNITTRNEKRKKVKNE